MPAFRCLMAIGALLLMATAAGAAEPADPGFTTAPIAGSVYVLGGPEYNSVVSAGDDGIVVVDTQPPSNANKLLAAVRRLSDKPIRFVIYTHVHDDHAGGNAVFHQLAPVIVQHTVRARMATGNAITGDQKAPPEALPIVTFNGEATLHLNGEDIRLLSVPPAHTDGDVVVVFKNANVVAMGDLFMPPAASFGEQNSGGTYLGLISALEFVLPQIPADAKIIPGHDRISTRADIVRGLEVLKGMKAVVESGVRAGKTLAQLQAERPFDKWRDSVPQWTSSDKSLDGWIKEIWREIAPKPASK